MSEGTTSLVSRPSSPVMTLANCSSSLDVHFRFFDKGVVVAAGDVIGDTCAAGVGAVMGVTRPAARSRRHLPLTFSRRIGYFNLSCSLSRAVAVAKYFPTPSMPDRTSSRILSMTLMRVESRCCGHAFDAFNSRTDVLVGVHDDMRSVAVG